jgi:hypothetical protein
MCGKDVKPIVENMGPITGYQCINPDCSIFMQPWSIDDHKDNQDWAVRHIRLLEKENDDLKKRIELLEAK